MISARTAIAAAALSGIALWVASPAVGVGLLAWVALVPIAVVVLRGSDGRASRLAAPLAYTLFLELLIIRALPFGIADRQWGDTPIPLLIGGSPVLPIALVAVPLIGLLLYALRFGQAWGLERLPGAAGTLASVTVPAFAWTALELVRTKLDPGGFFGTLFASQADLPTAGIAAIGGPWLITFAIVAVNYAIALTLVRAWESVPHRTSPVLRAGTGVAILVGASLALVAVAPAGGGQRTLTVAAVQPGFDTAEESRPQLRFWERGTYHLAALDLIRDLSGPSADAAAEGAELIVWPEAMFFIDPRRSRVAMNELRKVSQETGAALVVPFFERGPNTSASFILLPDGREMPAQEKRRPMWFLGERASPANGARVADLGALRVASLLGVDTQDAAVAREAAGAGANLITSSTHDWRRLAGVHQAFAAISSRSSGLPIVRADWRYGSAIYDRDGTLVADAGSEKRRAALVADVALGAATPYVRLGDAVGWIALAATLAAWLGGVVPPLCRIVSPAPRRGRHRTPPPARGGRDGAPPVKA